MQKKAVAFTGHRPESLPFGRDMHSGRYDDFELILWKEIRRCMDEGYDTFYCGGARGVDIVCGEIVIAEKLSKHPDIRLVCAIPYREQAEKWGWMWRTRYLDLLRAADKIEQMCSNYQRGCYHMRNRYMVDNCDLLIAIYNGENKGGTAYTVNYAREWGKEILIIDPNTLEKRVIPAAFRRK